MFWRTVSSFFALLAGAVLGWLADVNGVPYVGALVGALSAGLIWFCFDSIAAWRWLVQLRTGVIGDATWCDGIWRESAQRVRRLLRTRDDQYEQSQRRLQDFLSALQASPNGVVLLDQHTRIEWCNQTAAQHFGIEVQRDLAQVISNLVRDPAFVRYLAEADFSHSVTMTGRDSSSARPVSLSVQLHPYGEGRSLLLSRDVTMLEQADAMRRDFVANVSHEIRTPLTVLAGFVETLQSLPLEVDEQQHYLTLMSQQAGRMQTLVSDLLTLSRLEGSPSPGCDSWTPLSSLMEQLERDAQALSRLVCPADSASQELMFETSAKVEIAGNASELLSAMGNLVSNAIRYTPAAGHIAVRAALTSDGGVCFSVQDSGQGIAPQHLGRLTERFYRVDRSRSRETGGTGLGLAIVKHVVQRHQGTLSIDSTPGQGSCFQIVLPSPRVRPITPGRESLNV
jgi:two-component system phosphate regulon sensor histidine kinase PhoR